MEWVETTGRTLEEAKENALDQLGVDESDAEFEVIEQPRPGLFGRLRGEARVRARVRPATPRPKDGPGDRRRRRNSRGASTQGGGGDGGSDHEVADDVTTEQRHLAAQAHSQQSVAAPEEGTSGNGTPEGGSGGGVPVASRRRRRRRHSSRSAAGKAVYQSRGGSSRAAVANPEGSLEERLTGEGLRSPESPLHPRGAPGMEAETIHNSSDVQLTPEEEAQAAREFLEGLLREFGLQAQVVVKRPGPEEIHLDVEGQDLGLLIGPKGSTLMALQELTRSVVHHRGQGLGARIRLDVSGYRKKRSEALGRFAQQVALRVRETGTPTALEPMSAPDRKVVHDAVASIEGVTTVSDGEEPRRRVVIVPQRS